MSIEVDAVFDSYSALKYISEEKQHSVLCKGQSENRSSKRRVPNRNFNTKLVYSEIVYCCIHGGKAFKSESKGERPNQL